MRAVSSVTTRCCDQVRLSGVQSNSGGASLRLAVAGAATVLSQGAPLWLCGSEDEGIGDAAAALQHFFTKAEEIAQDGRSRVLRAYRCDSQPKSLEEFSSVVRLTLSEVGLALTVWGGPSVKFLVEGGSIRVSNLTCVQDTTWASTRQGSVTLMTGKCGLGCSPVVLWMS